ncbi:MAG: hypothetical protein IJH08_04525 [Atopobiaceae bacterium]|nr:hypothetical protein [Atopobiaceae bacterium]
MAIDDIETMGQEDAPDAIYDATTLGTPRMVLFGLQHLFAMFGATVLVPALTGLSVQATLLFAGLGTLLFHFLAKGKVPAFLGSSFASSPATPPSPPTARRSFCPMPAWALPPRAASTSSLPHSSSPLAPSASWSTSRPW